MIQRYQEQNNIKPWARSFIHFLVLIYLSIAFLCLYTYLFDLFYHHKPVSLIHYLEYFMMQQIWLIALSLLIYGIVFYCFTGKLATPAKVVYLSFIAVIFSLWCFERKVFPEKAFGYSTILYVYLLTGVSLLLVQVYYRHRSKVLNA